MSKTAGKKKNRSIGTLLLSLLFVCLLSVSALASENAISMKLDYGYRNTAKSGQLLPVTVTFENSTGEMIKGFLSVEVPGEDGSISYTTSVKIPEGTSDVKRTITVPDAVSGKDGDRLSARLFDSDGFELASVQTMVNYLGNGREVLCGVLSDDQQNLLYLGSISLGENLSTRVVTLNPANLPEEEDGLNQLDVIVISQIDVARISEAGINAIMDWVEDGGTLLIGTGQSTVPFGGFKSRIGNPELFYSSIQSVDMGMQYSTSGPDGAVMDLVLRTIRWDGAEVIQESGEKELVQRRAFGKGAVCLSEYDFCDISEFCTEHPGFIQDLLSEAVGPTGIERIQGSTLSSEERLKVSSDLTNTYDEKNIPGILVYVALSGTFLCLAGSVLYRVLSGKGLAIYYMLGVLVVSLIFTLTFWFVSGSTRVINPFIRYGIITESSLEENGERKASIRGYIDLQSPGKSAMTLELPQESSILPVITNGEISITSGKKKMLAVTGQKQFETNIFQVEQKSIDFERGIPLMTSLTMGAEGISGTVTNQSGIRITGLSLIYTGRILYLGDLEPGESRSFDAKDGAFGPVTVYELVSSYLSKKDNGSDYAYQRGKLRTYCLRESVAISEGKALLMGFAEEYTPVILRDITFDIEGSSLFVIEEAVATSDGKESFERIVSTEPKVVSGSYDSATNCLKGSGATILEYSLGNDFDLTGIRQVPLSEELSGDYVSAFSGQLAIYNYTTGSFDLADAGKTQWDISELKPYLSPANNLTVRYLPDESSADLRPVYLPAIYVQGEGSRQKPESAGSEGTVTKQNAAVVPAGAKESRPDGPVTGPVIESGEEIPPEN